MTNINDATDIIPLQITQSVLGGREKLYRVDPLIPMLPNQRYQWQLESEIFGNLTPYRNTMNSVFSDTGVASFTVAHDTDEVFGHGGTEGIAQPGDMVGLGLSLDTGSSADGTSRELLSVDLTVKAVGLSGVEEFVLNIASPSQVAYSGMSRQVYDLWVSGARSMAEDRGRNNFEVGFVAHLSDGTNNLEL